MMTPHWLEQAYLQCSRHAAGRVRHAERGRLRVDDLLQLMDYLLCMSGTLEEGLHQWAHHFQLLGQPWEVQITYDSDGRCRLRWLALSPLPSGASLPAWLGYLCYGLHGRLLQFSGGQLRWWLRGPGGQLPPLDEVAPPLRLKAASELLLEIDPSLLASHYQGPALRALALAELLGQRLLADLPPRAQLAERIRHLLAAALPQVPDERQVAAHFGLSVRALQRQLKAQDSHFGALLAQVRHARAIRELAWPDTPLPVVAARVGFAEQSSFQRAFVRWHGITPGQYRRQLRHHHQPLMAPPVRLYLARNLLQTEHSAERRGGQVWVAVSNLSFEKRLEVLCIDADGIRRAYPASFVRFLAPGRELWCSVNLPVAEPLTFSLRYQVGGETYSDDDHGHPYILSRADGVRLGEPPLVLHQALAVEDGEGGWWWQARLYTQPWPGLSLCAQALNGTVVALTSRCVRTTASHHEWQLAGRLASERLRFVLSDGQQQWLDDNDGQGYPLNWD